MTSFLSALRDSHLLMDGAMGTELIRAGARTDDFLDLFNLVQSERVSAVHRDYVAAGARVLLTNTFQTNPDALAKRRCTESLSAIFEAGISLARDAVGSGGWVVAAVGPWGTSSNIEVRSLIQAAQSADALLLETLSDVDPPRLFIDATLPLLISFTFRHDPTAGTVRTFSGRTPRECAAIARSVGAIALGVNCGLEMSMADIADVLRDYRAETDLPLFARPNAGSPRKIGDTLRYPLTAAMMAHQLPLLLKAEATMIGGCCGTTPEHMSALAAVMKKSG